MEQPLLSISIPTFNRARHLKKCLECLTSQFNAEMHGRLEVLVSDNASEDNTPQVVQQFVDKGFGIKYSRNKENIGGDRNISKSFLTAKGKFVWVFSDDDFILPGYLPLILNLLDSSDASAIYVNSLWYERSFEQPQKPLQLNTTVYKTALKYAEQVNYWCTFLTGNIVNKTALSDAINPETFHDTSMVQLGWILPAMFAEGDKIIINDKAIACASGNSGGYKLFEVFGKKSNYIIDTLIGTGKIDKSFKKIFNKNIVATFLPQFVYNSKMDFHRERPLALVTALYWRYPQYWRGLFPLLVKKQIFNTAGISKFVAKVFHKVINSGYYRQVAAAENAQYNQSQFSALGANAMLPATLTVIGPQYITIGSNFQSGANLRIEAWDNYAGDRFNPQLTIGNNVSVGTDVHIGCINKISIANGVLMGSRIYITDHSHGEISAQALNLPPVDRRLISKGPVVIEENVWIGEGVCIMPGIHVGKNAIIGANAVVTANVPANTVVAGVPARVIKTIEEVPFK